MRSKLVYLCYLRWTSTSTRFPTKYATRQYQKVSREGQRNSLGAREQMPLGIPVPQGGTEALRFYTDGSKVNFISRHARARYETFQLPSRVITR